MQLSSMFKTLEPGFPLRILTPVVVATTAPKEVLIQPDVRGKFVDLTDSIRSRVAG